MSLVPTDHPFLSSCNMSTLTTPEEEHASRAGSSEHSLTTTHVDNDTASQSNFRNDLSDVEKSAFSALGQSSTSLQTDPFYVCHRGLVGDVSCLLVSLGRVQG